METLSVSLTKKVTARIIDHIPNSLNSRMIGAQSPLSKYTQDFIVRKDQQNPETEVNVFDSEGCKQYSIRRHSSSSYQWYLYHEPENIEMAIITIGLFDREVSKRSSSTIKMCMGPGVRGKLQRHFYDEAGGFYAWRRRSHFLEKITNLGSENTTVCERVAIVRTLRKNEFDWSLSVDWRKVDVIDALTTGFIMMKSQWRTKRVTEEPLRQSYESINSVETSSEDFMNSD